MLLPQTASLADSARGHEWHWAPFVGYAQNSPVGNDWGVTPDWNHLFLGIQLEAPVLRSRSFSLSYAPVLLPLLVLTHHPAPAIARHAPIVAAGLAPFGLTMGIEIAGKHRVFGTSAIGGLWSNQPIPALGARAFNVTIEWGGGLALALRQRHALVIGYKFHHLSNVYTATQNPGLDGHVFVAGWRSTTRLGT